MKDREIYIVSKTDGTSENVLAHTFAEVIAQLGEDGEKKIWQIIKLGFQEVDENNETAE